MFNIVHLLVLGSFLLGSEIFFKFNIFLYFSVFLYFFNSKCPRYSNSILELSLSERKQSDLYKI